MGNYEGVYVATTDTSINGSGINGNKTFYIDGHLISDNASAILLGDQPSGTGGGNEVYISATAVLGAADNTIFSVGGRLTLTNLGSIFSTGERESAPRAETTI